MAALGAEAREEIVEAGVAGIAPVELQAVALDEPGLRQEFRLGARREQDMRARKAEPLAQLLEPRGERAVHRGFVHARRDQQPRPGRRREGHGDDQLRVVFEVQPRLGEVREAVVEDELALAVALDVRRRGRDQLVAPPHPEVHRHPAAFGAHAPGLFQRVEPVEQQERRRIAAGERAPALLTEIADGLVAPELERVAGLRRRRGRHQASRCGRERRSGNRACQMLPGRAPKPASSRSKTTTLSRPRRGRATACTNAMSQR